MKRFAKDSVEAFNKLGKGTIEVTYFQNDPYKAKIRTAIGAGEAPTLIFGWGGGIFKSYADAGQVDDLTSWLDEMLPSRIKSSPRRGALRRSTTRSTRSRSRTPSRSSCTTTRRCSRRPGPASRHLG